MPKVKPKDSIRRTSIDLPAALWREVRLKALTEGTTARAVIVAALERYVAKKGGS
jgi:hypothetical protein